MHNTESTRKDAVNGSVHVHEVLCTQCHLHKHSNIMLGSIKNLPVTVGIQFLKLKYIMGEWPAISAQSRNSSCEHDIDYDVLTHAKSKVMSPII